MEVEIGGALLSSGGGSQEVKTTCFTGLIHHASKFRSVLVNGRDGFRLHQVVISFFFCSWLKRNKGRERGKAVKSHSRKVQCPPPLAPAGP